MMSVPNSSDGYKTMYIQVQAALPNSIENKRGEGKEEEQQVKSHFVVLM